MLNKIDQFVSLTESEAIQLKKEHQAVILPFVDKYRYWRTNGKKHPVYDFLFSYYSFSPGQLLRWTPGLGIKIHDDKQRDEDLLTNIIEWPDHIRRTVNSEYINIDKFPIRRRGFLEWSIRYLNNTLDRPPVFHCFGMHEWAMVYKTDAKHHPQIPFRVSKREIEKFVESRQLCCTHYDAYRFFSPDSAHLNRILLTRDNLIENEQSGCIHANMDLYKFGYKVAPFISSNLLGKLFVLAKNARLIDMRASPYDLSEFDVPPLEIETASGAERYVFEQKKIHQEAIPLRKRLLRVYEELEEEIEI